MAYRPWGNIYWLLPKIIVNHKWVFCGCISSEERCLAAYEALHYKSVLYDSLFVVVRDPESKYTQDTDHRTGMHIDRLNRLTNSPNISFFDLEYNNYQLIYDFAHVLISKSQGNLVLDISCFPKRFFFPLVKLIYTHDLIHNFIIFNTTPSFYRSGPLAENFAEWTTLPFFPDLNENDNKEIVYISVGHMPMASLAPIQDIASSDSLFLFFPFPGHPDSFMLTWKFVFMLQNQLHNIQKDHIIRVGASDCSVMYDHLLARTSPSETHEDVLLAPFGPKPLSLAMALFAINFKSPVYYTQPRLYYPDYSSGVGHSNGLPSITGYCLKLNGKKLY